MSDGNGVMQGAGFSWVPPAPKATTSAGLPAALANLVNQTGNAAPVAGIGGAPVGVGGGGINMQALQMQPTGTVASNPNFPVLDFRMQPTYADGGQVGPMGQPMMGGAPIQGGAPMGGGNEGTATLEQMQGEAARIMQQHPEVAQKIQQAVMQAVQSGQITMEQLNTAMQMAVAAARNPALYPKLRALAIQRGLATEQDLPQQYDRGVVFAIILAAQAVQQQLGGGTANMPSQQLANGGRVETFADYYRPGFALGGDVPEELSPTGDRTGRADDIPIRVSGGEYVIPKHVVEAKGTEFFDKLLEQYAGGKKPKGAA